mmetsp:Transcript_10722/g.25762  ORF Transcript_10722/g.25762 Transcript_10722/m.25762 type:complete len:202 (+) Transcript_10722:134-739(+)
MAAALAFLAAPLCGISMPLHTAADLLQVPVGASRSIVRAAYRQKAAVSHPDMTTGDVQQFLQLRAAYDTCLRYSQAGGVLTNAHEQQAPARTYSKGAPWQPFVARREEVDSKLFSAWHSYWEVRLAANIADAKAEAQRQVCLAREAAVADTTSSEERVKAVAELAAANRTLQFLLARQSKLHEHALELEAAAKLTTADFSA